ncbi:MAG: hypothetical protein ACODAB_00565 [Gemmatimonadota bacterium]
MTGQRYMLGSLCRISDLADEPFSVAPLDRDEWATGDYVVGEVTDILSGRVVELTSGRMIEVAEGDLVVGAFGVRHATLEATGRWEAIEDDGRMHLLTGAGLLGRCTSLSSVLPPLPALRYRGHVQRGERKLRMADFVAHVPDRSFETPTILVVGSSMSAGKTTAARILIRQLKKLGLDVVGAKITGAGRYRDILTMRDAGADAIFDFVDAGLPSTVCPEAEYSRALEAMLSRIGGVEADVAVIEVGASPLEPYNGAVAVAALEEWVRLTLLCASDPYAVVGVVEAYGLHPDLVTGIATNTRAGVELIERLTDLPALNVRDKAALPELMRLLGARLGVEDSAAVD